MMVDCIPYITTTPHSHLHPHGNHSQNEAQWVSNGNLSSMSHATYDNGTRTFKNLNLNLSDNSSNWGVYPHPTSAYVYDSSDSSNTLARADNGGHPAVLKNIEDFLNSRFIVFICVFGVIGNVLNLIVLTRKGLQKSMDRMEKSAHYGLVALAVSDTLFCLTVLPHVWVDKASFIFSSRNFDLYYVAYESGVINTLIMSSTWLTVAMATSRYFAICHPLRAREIIGMTFANVSLIVVFLLCVLFNLPRFFISEVDSVRCQGGWVAYFINNGFLKKHPRLEYGYLCCYSVVGILVPLILLAFCNVNLIRALRQSMRMREQYKNQKTASKDSKHHITLTLIIIVIAYFLLVLPAEIINFLKQFVLRDKSNMAYFNMSVAVVNTLQAINFSFNFVLYCVVNVHFRRVITNMFCYWCMRSKRLSRTYSSVASAGSYVTRRTTGTDFELSTY